MHDSHSIDGEVPSPSMEWESCIINYRVYILPTDFRMSSSRGRKRRAPARFDEMSTMVGDRSSRGTDDLGTTRRRASLTTTSRSVAKSTRLSSAVAFTHGTSSIVAPPPIISAVATSHPMPSPCCPAVVSIRSRSVSASTRITSAATPRRSTSSAPSARRGPRRVPSPVVEVADYIPYEDAVSSDGEVPRCDDMQQQMAEMRREMAAMHNLVHVMASTTEQQIAGRSAATEQQIAGRSAATEQQIAGRSAATIQPITGSSTSAAQPIAAPSTDVGIVGERPNNMASFSSVPLGSLVDPKVKAKIWAGQFVELDSLVGEFSESPVLIFDTQNRNPSVQMRENVSRRIFNVAQWTDAFLVYVAIYTECHPTDVASILKYVQLVRSMAASARNNMLIAKFQCSQPNKTPFAVKPANPGNRR